MGSLKHLSKSISKVSGKTFERKFVTLGRLLNHWDLIVGKELAGSTTPIKITYRKNGKDKKLGLIIATDSSQAMLLHYRKDLIMQKINQILGDTTISEIRFVDRESKKPQRNTHKKTKRLTQNQEQDLSETLDNIDDADLKKTLERFGQSLMIDANNVNQNSTGLNNINGSKK